MTFIPEKSNNLTPFNEGVVTQKNNQLLLKPTWGVSALRDKVATTGTSTNYTESGGEIHLSTGTDSSASIELESIQRGQYLPGAYAEAGIGIRMPSNPTNTQLAEWGYFDQNKGFGFGVDSTGPYIFYESTQTGKSKTYQPNWNIDDLKGNADSTNPSGLSLDISEGVIYEINFSWYGYGTIEYNVFIYNPSLLEKEKITVHKETILDSASIEDPNLPITAKVDNGGSTTSNLDLYVGGRQFSIYGNPTEEKERSVVENMTDFTVSSAQGTWEPVMALRKKEFFGNSNRLNSVNAAITSIQMSTDNAVEYKLAVNGVTSSLSYSDPTDWDSGETAVETKLSDGTLTVSDDGLPVSKTIVGVNRNESFSVKDDEIIFMSSDSEIILFVKNTTSTSATISCVVKWQEER